MKSFTPSRSSSGRAAFLALFLAVPALASFACKSESKAPAAAAAPSGSASAGAVATGPCADYAKAVCDKAGAQSPTCESFKTATELMPVAACQAGLKDVAFTTTKLAAQRGPCDTLVKKLCDAVGPKTEACQLVTSQTPQFPPERCKMMLEHMPEIIADLQKMEAAKKPISPELAAKIAKGPVPSLGPENAAVQVVEFSDFECPYCSRAATVVHQIREKYGDKVRIVFRQFPLQMHPNAHLAAQAALAANEQGKFWQFHDLLFKNQSSLTRPALEAHAKEVGLDVGAFKKSLDAKKFASNVDSDMKLGEEVSVQGTPTLFVNGQRVENPTDFAAVAGVIDKALGTTPPG